MDIPPEQPNVPRSRATSNGSENVSIGPVPDWVVVREADESYRAPVETQVTQLLLDQQHHATKNEVHEHRVWRMDSLSAIQHGSHWQCDFDPSTQDVVIHSLAIRRAGAVTEHASLEKLRFLQREENLERFIIDGWVTMVLLFEDVRVGDLVETSYTIRTRPRIFAGNCSFTVPIPTQIYTRQFCLSVRFPTGHPRKWRTDSQKLQLTERVLENGETEWSWQVQRFAPREPEPDMPTWHFHGRIIQVSDFPSWAYFAARGRRTSIIPRSKRPPRNSRSSRSWRIGSRQHCVSRRMKSAT
jgi:hypothetical protein